MARGSKSKTRRPRGRPRVRVRHAEAARHGDVAEFGLVGRERAHERAEAPRAVAAQRAAPVEARRLREEPAPPRPRRPRRREVARRLHAAVGRRRAPARLAAARGGLEAHERGDGLAEREAADGLGPVVRRDEGRRHVEPRRAVDARVEDHREAQPLERVPGERRAEAQVRQGRRVQGPRFAGTGAGRRRRDAARGADGPRRERREPERAEQQDRGPQAPRRRRAAHHVEAHYAHRIRLSNSTSLHVEPHLASEDSSGPHLQRSRRLRDLGTSPPLGRGS